MSLKLAKMLKEYFIYPKVQYNGSYIINEECCCWLQLPECRLCTLPVA
ncbi:hypothetical protein [Mucilaginibacter sp.]